MSYWQILTGYEHNLVPHPGFEEFQSTIGWFSPWYTGLWYEQYGLTLAEAFTGQQAMYVKPAAGESYCGACYEFEAVAGQTYTLSIMAKSLAGYPVSVWMNLTPTPLIVFVPGTTYHTIMADGTWQQHTMTYTEVETTTRFFFIARHETFAPDYLYLDDFSITSRKSYDLQDDLGFYVKGVTGAGMPPVQNIRVGHGVKPGETFQRSRVQTRVVQISGTFAEDTRGDYHAKRQAFIDRVAPDRGDYLSTGEDSPVVLQYSGGDTPLQLFCYYDSGLEGQQIQGHGIEQPSLRFLAFDPFWYGGDGGADFALQETLAVSYIAMRNKDGAWDAMAGGVNGNVQTVIRDLEGNLIVGGDFTQAGGVTAYRVAKYDVGTGEWSALGNGFDGIVYKLLLKANGNIVALGNFQHNGLGSGTYRKLAEWSRSAYSWSELGNGAGTSDTVYDGALDAAGNLYIVGNLSQVGIGGTPVSVHDAARLDTGGVWHTLGTYPDDGLGGGVGISIAIAPAGQIYVTGQSEELTINGATDTLGVARNDPATDTWYPLGYGIISLSGSPRVAVDKNGRVYTSGAPSPDGVFPPPAIVEAPAVWDGISWKYLNDAPTGHTSGVIAVSPEGEVYVQVDNTVVTAAIDNIAFFDGYQWLGLAVNLPGTAAPTTIRAEDDGVLIAGFSGSGSATVAGSATITSLSSAPIHPVFTIRGGGRLYQLINATTGESIFFDLEMQYGEIITLDLQAKTLTSSLRGDMLDAILPGSNLTTWRLVRGDNVVSLLGSTSLATVTMTWRQAFWSFDGGGA